MTGQEAGGQEVGGQEVGAQEGGGQEGRRLKLPATIRSQEGEIKVYF